MTDSACLQHTASTGDRFIFDKKGQIYFQTVVKPLRRETFRKSMRSSWCFKSAFRARSYQRGLSCCISTKSPPKKKPQISRPEAFPFHIWCTRRDSNPRPLPSEGSTLSS